MNSSKSFLLRLLGGPSLASDNGELVTGPAAQRHRVALLALVALAPGGSISRDKLIWYLWPESDTEHARQLLNQSVYRLRKAMGEGAVITTGDEVRLNPEVIRVDAVDFESALAAGDAASAVAIYRGPLLDGFFLSDAPDFTDWVEQERGRLAASYARALEELAGAAETAGDFPRAAEWWKARAKHDPYDSRIAVRLMEALDTAGNRAAALQHAEQHSRLLHEEFGIEPAPEVAALTERLRQARPADATPHLEAPVLTEPTSFEPRIKTTPAQPPRRRARYVIVAMALMLVAASGFWLVRRGSGQRWLLQDALPRIEAYLDVADWENAYALARTAQQRVPDSPELAAVWTRMSWRVTIHSKPEGARVFRQSYDAQSDEWEELGQTPLVDVRVPYGLSKLRLEKEGYRPLLRAIGGAHLNWTELKRVSDDELLVGPDTFTLDTDRTLPPRMVRVSGWKFIDRGDTVAMRDFFIDQYEVTNKEFKAFVDAGGYQKQQLWDPIVVNGQTVPWAQAMARFVDRTGRPGPSTWEAGDFPSGEADFPVSGVSWYEAAAYARFARRELPTARHWQEALANSMFPWLLPASNFGGKGPRAVTASHAFSHVGAFDLTGNAREWTATAIGTARIILGGSWNDPYYVAGLTDSSAPPEDRSPGNGFRLALTFDDSAAARHAHASMVRSTTASPVIAQVPVSDDVYAAYSRVFDYDRGPLDASIESTDTTLLWIRQRVRFSAGYADERMLLHLYLPVRGRPPYQTVVYWPGWDTFWLDDADEYFAKQADFIVKSGRAVAFPIYRGIFERRVGDARRRASFGTAEYRDNTIYTVKDLRRSIDYLETRADVNTRAIGFYGYSWGGVNGPVALAQEPRLRVAVIQIGLLPPMTATPEVDPVNALPRVRVPTLLFSGEFDAMVPMENSNRYFSLIGSSATEKRRVIAIGGHFIPRALVIRESLDWYDKFLGPVNTAAARN